MIIAACISALSNVSHAQVSLAPEIGLNLANIHQRYTDISGETKNANGGLKLGVKAGVNADIMLGNRIALQPGLFYSIKGAKIDDDPVTISGITYQNKNNITLHYFEIPVNVQYYFNDPSEGRFFVGLGAYVGVAFSGKNKLVGHVSPGTDKDTVIKYKFGDDYPSNDLRRFDFGAAANVGYMLRSGIFFRGMYQLGITNLVPGGNRPDYAADDKATNSVVTISVGKQFGNTPRSKGPRMHGSYAE
jgi:hypothetical protein